MAIDEIDRALAHLLRADGRASTRSLAEALSVSQATVASRLRQLEQSAVRVVALTDFEAFGYRLFCFSLLRTAGHSAIAVGRQIAQMQEVTVVNVVSGRFNLVAAFLARDIGHLSSLQARIRSIEGVASVDGLLVAQTCKFVSWWARLGLDTGQTLPVEPNERLDQTDLNIVRHLHIDARTSNRSIAAELGLSEGTIRTRIARLEEDNVIRIQAISDIGAFGIQSFAYVGVRCEGSPVEQVAQHLALQHDIGYVARTFGCYDLFLLIASSTRSQLMSTVFDVVATAPGVAGVEVIEGFQPLKHVYSWTRLLAAENKA